MKMNTAGFSWNDLLAQYRMSLEAANRSPRTIEWYMDILQHFFLGYLGSRNIIKPINEIGREEVRTYVKHLQGSKRWPNKTHSTKDYGKLSPFTIQGKVRALKAFWSWLFREEHIKSNPLADYGLPSVPQNLIVVLEKEQIKILLNTIDKYTPVGSRNYCILLLLIDTGLRISELTCIKLIDINFTQSYVKVVGKGQKERMVPFYSLTRKELTKYINRYRPNLCSIDSSYLFPTKDGDNISVNSVQQMIKRLAITAGLNIKCHPHIFRHTCATMFLARGGSPVILKEIMGHESFQTTQKYIHLQPEDLRKQHMRYSPVAYLFED